jgi:hypothetical protein
MPYIGKNLVGILKEPRTSDTMTGDGSDTTLTLTDTPGSTNNVLVFLDGIRQTPVTDYTVMGNTLTFTTAPEAGVLVVALTGSASSIDPKMGSVTSSKIVDGMVGNAKIVTMAASKLTGALPAISGANLTNVSGTGIDNVTSDPTISTNPSGGVGTIHLNQNSGEMFVCTDATAGANVWYNVGGGDGDVEPWIFQGTIAGYTAGGQAAPAATNEIQKNSFASDSNSTDIGNLQKPLQGPGGNSAELASYFTGGNHNSGGVVTEISKMSYASEGNSSLISGVLTVARQDAGSSTSSTHGYTSGGQSPVVNTIDKFSFSTDGNATDVGDLTSTRAQVAAASSVTHGYTLAGAPPGGGVNAIDKFAFATDGNATDVGNMFETRRAATGNSSTTHGYASGGYNNGSPTYGVFTIEKTTFASDNNGTDVGELTVGKHAGAKVGYSSTTHGYSAGGLIPAYSNVIDKYSFSVDANATDVGDLVTAISESTSTQH